MIKQLMVEEEAGALALFRKTPCLGAQMEADWILLCENPQTPVRFFAVDGPAVLAINAMGALLCGRVQNPRELEMFLQSQGVGHLFSQGWAPAGWQHTRVYPMQATAPVAVPKMPTGFTQTPAPSSVMALLRQTPALQNPVAANAFYASMCARCNHGLAQAVGICENSALASTAGIYALTPHEAYIAAVHTSPAARKKGYAGALVGWLCGQHKSTRYTLLCTKQMQPFYAALGFTALQNTIVESFTTTNQMEVTKHDDR